ncbi:Conserved oligomeric Golgi complex subunit 4 [Lecanosticta acicola]|uniref:Conserved oligomeric Golgi complex subunit 4 n=1 Tax=Lecanosticta acicola TaxID=111012 RepID=A0AAI8YV15_9PEZI|nr:Conserved oligomeric Golgi complex subunit 4 [Lecanosticta acicola]
MAEVLANGHHHPSHIAPDVYTADSVEDIRNGLAELSQRDAAVTARLDTLLQTQKDVTRQLGRLDLARAQLGSQVVATRNISNGMLSSAASTAHRISGAVKKLDREQAAVKATLEVVEQVAELKACVLGVHGSMGAPQDWETAANYLFRASKIPDAVIDGAFAEEIVPTAEVPDPPRQTLNAAAESLCGLFLREFEKAAKEGDGARVTRFFKLFPLVGRSDVGLDAYGRYVCSGIASRARSNMSSTQRREGMFYANALTKLFEHIAQIVDGHEPLVERHYGPGSMTKVIERIQVEADAQGGLILDNWADERRVSRKLTEVKSYPFNFLVQSFLPSQKPGFTSRSDSPAPGSGRASEDESVDMKEVDALLSESAMMLGRWSLYARFLASKTTAATDENPDAKLHLPAFLVHSTLQKKVTDLLVDPFNLMATFFFRRSVEKSFQLDEAPADLTLNPNKQLGSNPPFITSAVDDVMYIVNQVLQRTLSTSQRSVVSSVVPSVGRVLGSDFFGMVQRKMRDESYPKAAIQGALPTETLIVSFLVLINNLDVATDYVKRIVRTATGSLSASQGSQLNGHSSALADSFPFGNEALTVEKTLHNMESGFEAKTSQLINEAIEVMLKQVMRPRLRPVIQETFRDVDYNIPSEGAGHGGEDQDSDDLVTQRFERGWQAFTLPIKRILTPSNYDKLITITIAYFARTLEKRIWSYHGRVNELGAVRLERDIAGIVAAAVKGGKYELRDSFARCVQMTLILNMEDDEWEEIAKLNGAQLERDTGVAWKLDAEERRKVRAIVKDR